MPSFQMVYPGATTVALYGARPARRGPRGSQERGGCTTTRDTARVLEVRHIDGRRVPYERVVAANVDHLVAGTSALRSPVIHLRVRRQDVLAGGR